MAHNYLLSTVGLFLLLTYSVKSCEENELRYGCRIYDGECFCGLGCGTIYRYASQEDCHLALQGELPDPCTKNPCKNKGICTQISEYPRYQCACAGTGYYGSHCEIICPNSQVKDSNLQTNYPVPCVEI